MTHVSINRNSDTPIYLQIKNQIRDMIISGKLPAGKNIFYQETKAGVLSVELSNINNEKVFIMIQTLPKFEVFDPSKSEIAGLIGLDEDNLIDLPAMRVSTGIWWLVFGVKTLDKLMT